MMLTVWLYQRKFLAMPSIDNNILNNSSLCFIVINNISATLSSDLFYYKLFPPSHAFKKTQTDDHSTNPVKLRPELYESKYIF